MPRVTTLPYDSWDDPPSSEFVVQNQLILNPPWMCFEVFIPFWSWASGKHRNNHGTSACFMGKSTTSISTLQFSLANWYWIPECIEKSHVLSNHHEESSGALKVILFCIIVSSLHRVMMVWMRPSGPLWPPLLRLMTPEGVFMNEYDIIESY